MVSTAHSGARWQSLYAAYGKACKDTGPVVGCYRTLESPLHMGCSLLKTVQAAPAQQAEDVAFPPALASLLDRFPPNIALLAKNLFACDERARLQASICARATGWQEFSLYTAKKSVTLGLFQRHVETFVSQFIDNRDIEADNYNARIFTEFMSCIVPSLVMQWAQDGDMGKKIRHSVYEFFTKILAMPGEMFPASFEYTLELEIHNGVARVWFHMTHPSDKVSCIVLCLLRRAVQPTAPLVGTTTIVPTEFVPSEPPPPYAL